ncbi:hypothetical protein A0H81_01202 [Grifola frondosa]|uniref:Uncharacterized protein n=1 Tax=Grifola frondosa TaxID=5627 RepID=A0A1C7MRU2_GRIFR|nr:hypothetical protein A0H81_01202 [Grifola frondosa]
MSIHKRLLHAEEDFLLAVIEGIAILADSFHEVYVVNQRLTTDLMDELDMITSQLAALDLKPHLPSSSPPQKSNAKHKVLSSPEQESSIVLQRYHRLASPFDESSILQSSPTPSLVSLSTVDDSDEDIAPVPIIGRKRNASFMDDPEIGSAKCDRMVKRLRAASFEQNAASVGRHTSQLTETVQRPILSSPFVTTMSSPSVEASGSLPKTFTSPVAAPSSLSNLVEFPVFTQEVGCVSAHDFPDLSDSETKTISPLMVVESSPPSYQLNSPSIAATESTESDVISLYTTLYDADHTPGPLTSGDIHLPALDLSATCPPSFSQSVGNEEDWIQFLSTLDQPPEVVLTTPPPPYDLSTDVARLLESLLEVADALPADFSPVPSDKQNKLKELKAAKEAVRRLEVEVGISVL